MKKLISLLLALLMVFSLATVAFADEITDPIEETVPTNGTITINGVTDDGSVTYEIYCLLDLESYNKTSGAYSYKVNAEWTGFFATDEAKQYVTIDEAGYVTWIAAEDDDTVAAFAKKALAYAKEHDIDPVKSSANEGEFTTYPLVENGQPTGKLAGKFTDLPLGWYLVDSTVGALCGLTTTNPDASINAKNGQPTIDKQVKEDSTNQYVDENTADIGQIVEFRTTINVHAGAQNYVMHDNMSDGLTFKGIDKIEHVIPGVKTTEVAKTYYELVTKEAYEDVASTVNAEIDCTFEIRFTQEFCDHLETNDKIIVYYKAMLNRDAVIAGAGNNNETWLDYGENNHTTHDSTVTKTYSIDIVKTDSQNTLIDGAEFRIYDAAEGGNEVGVVPLLDSEGNAVYDDNDNPIYRRAREDEMEDKLNVSIVVTNGKITVVGLDNGTYYLEETVAPAGYNKLTARQKFIISDANLSATFNDGIYSTGSGVHVVNKTGTMLPETGAAGTFMFICFGTFMVLATGVLLVTKKRMAMIQE